ncbi:MAG: 7-carboxy-7-deazaguanine synthase QueE [Nitrospira bacterium HGW-Nitrospira-1]|nr:MAG: 7-carboxy-7-deazaguanine synthase QueE [Nitrospira bacterium HGW-Nitrospira-1]
MKVCEIFTGIQGESTFAGLPCTFIRLSGCNLRCVYCDTKYSYDEGVEMEVGDIAAQVSSAGVRLVEITGGEPLLQGQETISLMRELLDRGYEALVETNGSMNIGELDKRATIILDMKTPGSGMSDKMDLTNLEMIKNTDEVKFVICSRDDYEWSKEIVSRYGLEERCKVLFSPAFGMLRPRDLAAWIIEDRLRVRLNIQIHKYIFDPNERRV